MKWAALLCLPRSIGVWAARQWAHPRSRSWAPGPPGAILAARFLPTPWHVFCLVPGPWALLRGQLTKRWIVSDKGLSHRCGLMYTLPGKHLYISSKPPRLEPVVFPYALASVP